MVTLNPVGGTPEVPVSERGMVGPAVAVSPTYVAGSPLPSFWGSVVAGAVVAIGIGALSEALMFGCHVGINSQGVISFGVGAAIWLIVTSFVAYYIGGMLASALSVGGGWLRGITLWGFTVPLTMLIAAAVSAGAGLAYAHTTHAAEEITNGMGGAYILNGNIFLSYSGVWITFVTLAVALLGAVVGAGTACGIKRSGKAAVVR